MNVNVDKRKIVVALAGNPNSGKTTIFNSLTGLRRHVGNYPGVTVEKKEGRFSHKGCEVTVVDLPGTYSLTAYTTEEVLARNFVMEERPDLVVDVIDTSNLERNLYLATQFMELGVPLVLAFNMSDMAESRGFKIDRPLLEKLLGVTIVPTVGHKRVGIEALKDAIVLVAEGRAEHRPAEVVYGAEIERQLERISAALSEAGFPGAQWRRRWVALKLLENDKEVSREVTETLRDARPVMAVVESATRRLQRDFADSPEVLIADGRYGFISGACQQAVRTTVETRHTMSDAIDKVLTNQIAGIPIFLALMFVVFKLTFALGEAPTSWIDAGFQWLGGAVISLWPQGSESALRSLIVDGIIGGVGSVLVNLPKILFVFLAIAVLEDSGYMARAAFIMDHLMHKIGLHGKSFIPMLIGFGCTVPAVMATRTLETRRDRLTTMLALPLMSCSARLPIYALIIPAFFAPKWQAPVLWLMYFIGIALAVGVIKLLRVTLFRGAITPLLMELPPYRMPTVRGALLHMWERGWMFLRKAGTVILLISIVLWAMLSYPKAPEEKLSGMDAEAAAAVQLSHSIAGRIGRTLEPVMRPVGFDWRATTAMIGAFAAKELFVAQLGITYSLGGTGERTGELREKVQRDYTPLQGFSIMLFCLISAPCMMTIAVTWRESGSWKWAALQLSGLTVLAYVVSGIVYQGGLLLGVGTG